MKVIGIYAGNYQPPTKAHYQAYLHLRRMTGSDTFIVTTDRTPTPQAPLNFGDKEQIWVRQGVPSNHVFNIPDWKNPQEIFHSFSDIQTKAVFALNQKDASEVSKRKTRTKRKEPAEQKPFVGNFPEQPPTAVNELAPNPSIEKEKEKEVWLDTNGKPSYFQPYVGNENDTVPFSEHAYVLVVDDTRIEGRPVTTTNIRQVLGGERYGDDEKKKFFRFVFGWFDAGLYTLIASKFKLAYQVASPEVANKSYETQPVNRIQYQSRLGDKTTTQLQNMVREILGEIMNEDYGDTTTSSSDTMTGTSTTATTDDKTPGEQAADNAKQKQDLVKQKQSLELQAKQNKQQRDQYATTVKNYDQIKKKADRDALDAVNKQLSQPPQVSTAPVSPM